jgi:O-antigen/teichoic acid export membrane protein
MLEPVAKNAALLGAVALMAATSDTVRIGAVLAAQGCAYLFAVVVGFLWLKRMARRLVPTLAAGRTGVNFEAPSNWKAWRRSAAYFFVGSAAVLALGRLDVVLVNGLAGATAAGLFGAANRLIQIAMLGGLVLMGWLQPRIGAAIQDGNLITVRRTLVRGALASVVLTFVPVAICWLFAPWLMGLMGTGFAGSVFPFRVLLLGMAFWGLGFPVGYAFLSVSGRERVLARITWLQLIVTVSLVVVFAKSHGAVGGAFGYACGLALTSALAGTVTWRTVTRAWDLGPQSGLVGRG